ncbi:MAG TPA: zf-HC2 domain-containing protein [Gemmatimonadales bacterium]|nr:zf-HC2 domain-containing protein [Gemmatimonadales bacterium]
MPDHSAHQLSAYVDDELDRDSRLHIEAHLAVCPECRLLLTDLRAIVAAAPAYAGRAPSRDLWSGIEGRLGEAEVVPIGTRLWPAPSARFGWRELIAASVIMAGLGGGAVYLALRSGSSTGPAAPLALSPERPVPVVSPDSSGLPDRNVAYAERKYDSAVRDLELVLEAGRNRLDTATVRSVEESLSKIDAAIAEARAAIQRDPSNAYLNRQIAANMRRKLNLLRVATNAIAART